MRQKRRLNHVRQQTEMPNVFCTEGKTVNLRHVLSSMEINRRGQQWILKNLWLSR
jgi:hypothetical protein